MAGFTTLIMQADMLWGELWYQHAATDMGSGPQGCHKGGGGGQEPSESRLGIKKYTRVSKRGTREMINEGSVRQELMDWAHHNGSYITALLPENLLFTRLQ